MKPEEANKIIAEYMGDCWHCIKVTDNFHMFCAKCGEREPDLSLPEYVTSLDALVPVWEKLCMHGRFEWSHYDCSPKYRWELLPCDSTDETEDMDLVGGSWECSIQEAAAVATAKAIQELIGDTR